jgi:PucR family transcriptional regulator, purine catabolism regulatory protein
MTGAAEPTKSQHSFPAPTVREAMQIGDFAKAELVAGRGGLDRKVEWVRVMETPDTIRGLRPGDLLITTAFAVKDDRDAQLALVDGIARAGGAALVVKPERYLHSMPAEMLAEADRHQLPLFTLADDVPFVGLMEPLLERIINAEHWRLKRSLEIHARFTGLVLDGKGVNEIARTLSDLLGSSVSVEDASFHLLAHAGGSANDPHRKETIARHGSPARALFDPQVQRMLRQVESTRHPVKWPAFPHVGMNKERIVAPIFAANQVLGFISVIDSPPDQDELAMMAVEQAALVTAFAVTKEREVAEVESRVRGEFLDDLVQGTYGDEAAAQRRARHLGYPLNGSHLYMRVDIDDFRSLLRARTISEDAIQALKREFFRRVSAIVRGAYPRALLGAHSDSVFALLPFGPGVEAEEARRRAHALGLQVQQALDDWKPGFTVSVGFSALVEAPSDVSGAHREVTAVMDTLARFRRWNQVVSVPELGLTGLLAGVNHERLVEFSQRHLGPLLEHDRARSADLVATLKAYLEVGEQQGAARRLSIHPNTLRYRLDRIREISGAELEDPETRLNLSVALRVQGLLGL